MDQIDAEVLTGTTSRDLFSEIMNRTLPLMTFYEAYVEKKCSKGIPCSTATGCDLGPHGRLYCFMRFFQATVLNHDYKNVEKILETVKEVSRRNHNEDLMMEIVMEYKKKVSPPVKETSENKNFLNSLKETLEAMQSR